MKPLILLLMTTTLTFSATPNLWLNQQDIDKLSADIQKYPAARKDYDLLIAEADGWLDGSQPFLKKYPDIKWTDHTSYPKRPSGWGDAATKDWWEIGFGVHDLGLAYGFTGKEAYLEKCVEILKGLATVYEHYPQEKHGARWDDSKVFIQRLDEAIWGIDLAFGYSCIRHALAETDRNPIEDKLLRELVKSLYAFDGQGANNYTCVLDECAAAVGFALQDDKWIKVALDGYHKTDGYNFLVDNWIEDDGSTKEGTMGYHLMGLRALVGIAEAFRVAGRDIYGYNGNRIKKAMDFTIGFVYPDNTSPATHDGGRTKIESTGGSVIYQNMYLRFKDPVFLSIIKTSPTKLHSSQGNPELSRYYEPIEAQDLPTRSSQVFSHIGMAVLRGGSGVDPSFVLTDYGKFDFHGHLDKLNIVTFFAGSEMALDPGTFPYNDKKHGTWSVATGAHNTVIVDGKNQAEKGGRLVLFDTTNTACQVMQVTSDTVYKDVRQRRTLLLTANYLLDIFESESGTEHTYDWLYHNPGTLDHRHKLNKADGPLGKDAGYQHMRLTGRGAVDGDISVTFTRNDAAVTIMAAAEKGTELITADGLPARDDSSVPMIALRRKARTTAYTVVHDFRAKNKPASVEKIEMLTADKGCRAYKISGKGYTDLIAVADVKGTYTIGSGKNKTAFEGRIFYQRIPE